MRLVFVFIMFLMCIRSLAQERATPDSLSERLYTRGNQVVNKCTPWHHFLCVYITGTEVYVDGREGRSTRHWWRMSYIGQACADQHGVTFGKTFEALFIIPHYIGVGIGNGIGFTIYLIRGSPDQIQERKRARRQRKITRRNGTKESTP